MQGWDWDGMVGGGVKEGVGGVVSHKNEVYRAWLSTSQYKFTNNEAKRNVIAAQKLHLQLKY